METHVIESREGFVIGWKVTSDNSIWPEIYDVLIGWTFSQNVYLSVGLNVKSVKIILMYHKKTGEV